MPQPPVFAKNSIGHKDRIIHASVEGPRRLLNGRARSTFDGGVQSGMLLFLRVQSPHGMGLTPVERDSFLSENKPSRRPPLVPVMESTDFRKFDYGTQLRRLNGA